MLEIFRTLAEPNRLQIIDLLLTQPLPVGSVAERLNLRQPQASKHLRALADAGLLEVLHDAQRRIYALRPGPFQDLDQWLERYRNLFEDQFQRLDEVLDELKATKSKKEKRRPAKRSMRS